MKIQEETRLCIGTTRQKICEVNLTQTPRRWLACRLVFFFSIFCQVKNPRISYSWPFFLWGNQMNGRTYLNLCFQLDDSWKGCTGRTWKVSKGDFMILWWMVTDTKGYKWFLPLCVAQVSKAMSQLLLPKKPRGITDFGETLFWPVLVLGNGWPPHCVESSDCFFILTSVELSRM